MAESATDLSLLASGDGFILGDTTGQQDNFVYNLVTNEITPVSLEAKGAEPVSDSFSSANGAVDIDVLANDGDPNADAPTIISVMAPAVGSVVIPQDNAVTYTPVNDFAGKDGFDYVVSDGNGAISSGSVAVSERAPVIDLGNIPPTGGFTVAGTNQFDLIGNVVSGAGDINNDGIDDFLLTAYRTPSIGGQVYVVYGSGEPGGPVVDLANFTAQEGFIAVGAQTSLEGTGNAISAAGDVNNDGIDDFLIAARNNDAGGQQSGIVYVVFGKAGETRANLDLPTLAGTDGFAVIGSAGERVGTSVSSAGDVNDDGIDDFIIGATFRENGKAYVVYGKEGESRPDIDLGNFTANDGFIISAEVEFDYTGQAVSGGDVNGDGIGDLIIAAYRAEGSAFGSGKVYVVYGIDAATRGDVDLGAIAIADGFSILGAANSDGLGRSVSLAGDVNGDGVSDLLLSSYGDTGGAQAGEAYLIYGKTGTVRGDIDLANFSTTDGFRIIGDMEGDFLGVSVSAAGDVNGDGLADLILGAPNGDDGGDSAGEAYLIFGSRTARSDIDLSDLTKTDGVIFVSYVPDGDAGSDVSSAGDINNDGFDDLIIGASQVSGSAQATGEAYIIYGRADFALQPNISPVAIGDTAMTVENTAISIDVLENDTDANGDDLTVIAVSNPESGTSMINGDNTVTYIPGAGSTGTDSFTYTISDGNGGTATANVIVTVLNVNDSPLAGDDTVSAAQDTLRTIPAASLLANDSDADQDVLTITSVQGAVNGTVVLDGSVVTFTSDAGFTGAASFTYTVSDGNGGTDTATVNVNVSEEGNQPPIAPATQAATTLRGAAILVEVGASDPDGDVLSYGVSGAVNGTASVDEDGLVMYTPDAGFTGSETLVVTIDDGNGGSASQEIALTVSALPAANQFRLFASDGFAGSIGGSGAVIGTGGFQDIAVLDVAGTVSFDPSFNQGDDIVRLSGDADDWYVGKSGSSAIFTDGDTFVQLAVGPAGMAVVFDDGARTLRLDVGGGGAFLIGDQVFTATLARVDAAPDGTVLPGGGDAAASARLFLAEDGGASAAGKVNVIGTGGAEIATLLSGTITLDPSFNKGGDVIRVDEAAEDFLASKSGSSALLVGSDTTLLVPVGLAGATLAFGDGADTRELLLSIEPNGITIDEQFFGVDPVRLMAAV